MTKVAEDYRSAPERSSHPLLAPQGSDFSRWWEQAPEKTLAGLGPFTESDSAEDSSDFPELYLADAADDDDANEPTRLLTRSLLQLPPGIGPDSEKEAEPLQASRPGPAESTVLPKATAVAAAVAQSTSAAPAIAALDTSALDEFARRVSHDSVLRKWMAHSSPQAAAPSLLVPSKVALAPALPSVPPTETLQPLWRTVVERVSVLPRTRVSAVVAGFAAAVVLALLLLSRLGGSKASAEQFAARPAVPAVPTVPQPKASQALPVSAAATYITLHAGVGAEGAIVELIGDGHLRQVDALPARIAANRAETYRVHARRAGYEDFSSELVFGSGETEKDVVVELSPHKLLPSLSSPRGVSAPTAALPAIPPVAAAVAVPEAKPAGETLVRVKANAKPLAAGSAALSLNSIPFSTVIVDGRMQGLTPRLLQVTPGVHAVVFAHPDLGRRLVSVDVAAGTTAVAAVKF